MAAAAAAAYMYGGGSSAAYSGSVVGGGGAAIVKEEHHSPIGGSGTSPGVAHRAAALGPYGSPGSASGTPAGATDVRDMLGMYLHGTPSSVVGGSGTGNGSSPTSLHGGGLRDDGSPSSTPVAASRLMTQVNYDGFFRHHQQQSQQPQQQHMLGQSSNSPGMINNTLPLSHM